MDFKRSGISFSVPDRVIEQLVLDKLNGTEFATRIPPGTLPRIGAEVAELGGVFAGIARGLNGESDYMLIVGPEAPSTLEWQKAIDWATGVEHLGFSDFVLPLRKEQALLFANVPDLFKKEWYWSSEQHAGSSGNAWFQDFDSGGQYWRRKGSSLRARAVRRVPIQ